MQTEAMCLNRTIKYDLRQLQKAHATLHNDSAMAAKAQRKMNSLLAREYKSLLSDYMREKFCERKDWPIWGNDRLITRKSPYPTIHGRNNQPRTNIETCCKKYPKEQN